jgi:hypothetical protein
VSGLLDQIQDKIILYIRTRDETKELAELLNCPVYITKAGIVEKKKELLRM